MKVFFFALAPELAMPKKITCLACPQGCQLEVSEGVDYTISVSGNRCPKGLVFARQEMENPLRHLTTTVAAENLDLAWVPVRTSQPVPRSKIPSLLVLLHEFTLTHPVMAGDLLLRRPLGLDTEILATRSAKARPS
jgi:CxxC motif-containing protein